ncbi:copper resistance D family protein [Nocardia paucivorans]|uniref:copper resistance D family protein n=1 Tax=Nocardia paucivorans TaxID=114259 RepID=UPI000594C93E
MGTTPEHARPTALLPIVPAGLFGVALAWILATVTGAATVRFGADGAGAAVLGLAALPRLHDRLRVPWRMLAVLAGLWCGTEFTVLVFEAADVVGVGPETMGLHDFGIYLGETSSGQVGVVILMATAAITGYAVFAFRRPEQVTPDLVLVFAAVTLVLRPITGHMSQQPLGSVLAAIHTLAAAGWFGLLIGLALVVRGRGDWAVTLPRYSAMALPLVAVIATTGVVNGLVRIGGLEPLVSTGYGRILLAKTSILVILSVLGWWWRRTWVIRAAAHRMPAEASLRRAVVELTVMAPAFGLAASLAVTA